MQGVGFRVKGAGSTPSPAPPPAPRACVACFWLVCETVFSSYTSVY